MAIKSPYLDDEPGMSRVGVAILGSLENYQVVTYYFLAFVRMRATAASRLSQFHLKALEKVFCFPRGLRLVKRIASDCQPKKQQSTFDMKFQSISVHEAMKMISSGALFLPPIQRSFVWDRDRIENLFDSLYRDYPVGNCIFWNMQPAALRKYPLYVFTKECTENKKAKIPNEHAPKNMFGSEVFAVIDGQQRLSSLYIGLLGKYKYKISGKGRQNIEANFPDSWLHFNLLARASGDFDESYFKFLNKNDASFVTDKSLWVEVGHAMNWKSARDVERYLDETLLPSVDATRRKSLTAKLHADRPRLLAMLWRIQTMLHAERIFYFDVDNQNLDEVVAIFTRINSGGMTLKKSDLLFSLLVSQWQEGRDEIRNLVQSMQEADINVTQDFVLRCCLVLSGLKVKLNLDSFKAENIKKIRDNWEDIKVSLLEMCNLLPDIGYSPHPSLSENALVPIAYYIMSGAKWKSDTAKRHLRRYYAVAQVHGIFGGRGDDVLEKFVAEVKRQMEAGPTIDIKALISLSLPGGKSLKLSIDELYELVDEAPYGSPRAMFLLSLIFPDSKLKGGRYEVDHIHPRNRFSARNLKLIGVDEARIEDWRDWMHNALPNLQLLDYYDNASKRSKTIIEYIRLKPPKDRTAFITDNLLPKLNDPLLDLKNFDDFYEWRKKILVKKLKPHFGL